MFKFILLLYLVSACSTPEVVRVVEHHHDTVTVTGWQRDSIYVHDSVMVTHWGDTVYVDRWHTLWRERIIHDSIRVATRDSIPVPYPVTVTKQVPAPLSWWQRTRIYVGGVASDTIAWPSSVVSLPSSSGGSRERYEGN